MILSPIQMKAAEERLFQSGDTPEHLMEIAGEGIANVIRQFFPSSSSILVYCGKGHNGGDALVAALSLEDSGWRVLLRMGGANEDLAPLTRRQLDSLNSRKNVQMITSAFSSCGATVILDGLLGISATGVPSGLTVELIEEMNRYRGECGAFTVAVDLPSGIDVNSGERFDPCVQADLTVTIGAVKSCLLADSATTAVGRIALVSLPNLALHVGDEGDPAEVMTSMDLRRLLPVRDFDTFKGNYGRIGVLAGSIGYFGAAKLASTAAVHAGGGLVTLYAMPDTYPYLASMSIPEVMVKPIASYKDVIKEKLDALAFGPGLGKQYIQDLRSIFRDAPMPCVVDADALNALATTHAIQTRCLGPRLLTPHPGELERLYPCSGRSRREWGMQFSEGHNMTLLLKGARTIITERGVPPVFNTTGTPGMATGGMGDVLSGVCAAMLGSGRSLREAAMLGAWLCARAGEIAIFNDSDSQESLSATSVINHLGDACTSLRRGDY